MSHKNLKHMKSKLLIATALKNFRIKKLLLLSLIVFCFACKKQHEPPLNDTIATTPATSEIPQSPGVLSPVMVQNPLLLEGTAVWCGYCPSGGTVTMKQMMLKYPKVVGIALHNSDLLSTTYPLIDTLNKIFIDTVGGIPNFDVDNQDASSWPETLILSEQNKTPLAAVGHHWVKNNNQYTIQVRVKFGAAATGNYYIGTYALQNGIAAAGPNLYQHDYVNILTQSPSPGIADTTKWIVKDASYTTQQGNTDYWFKPGNIYYHDHIPTAFADGIASPWGQNLGTTSFNANDSLDFNFNITTNSSWTKSIEIVTILWQKNGSTYNYINGYH